MAAIAAYCGAGPATPVRGHAGPGPIRARDSDAARIGLGGPHRAGWPARCLQSARKATVEGARKLEVAGDTSRARLVATGTASVAGQVYHNLAVGACHSGTCHVIIR